MQALSSSSWKGRNEDGLRTTSGISGSKFLAMRNRSQDPQLVPQVHALRRYFEGKGPWQRSCSLPQRWKRRRSRIPRTRSPQTGTSRPSQTTQQREIVQDFLVTLARFPMKARIVDPQATKPEDRLMLFWAVPACPAEAVLIKGSC